jgi:multidrug resistance protein
VLARLSVLIVTAFIDMVGLLMILPLLPFYARHFGAAGTGVAVLVTAFTAAQLLSAPLWGRFSDRYGRRPALLIGLAASAIAYVVFAYANSLWLMLLSRVVQGAGGGTVGVIQAYVADSVEPNQRAKALGWLSASTNVGVALGPPLGSFALGVGGRAGPGLIAAGLCVINVVFAWMFLRESRDMVEAQTVERRRGASREALTSVLFHWTDPAPRLIWIYAITMGAFQGLTAILALYLSDRFGVSEHTIWIFFTYIGVISVVTRAGFLGIAVERFGEARLARVGLVLLLTALGSFPFVTSYPMLALMTGLMPLGTAFTFPCVTSLLIRKIDSRERGLYMGVQQTYAGIARIVIPLLGGFTYDHVGRAAPFLTSAVLVLGSIALGFGIEDERRAPPATVAAS